MSDLLPKAQPAQQAAVEDEVQSLEDGITDAHVTEGQKELKRLRKEVVRKERRKRRKQTRERIEEQDAEELEKGKEVGFNKTGDSNKAGRYKRVSRHGDIQDDENRQHLVDDRDDESNPDGLEDQDDEGDPDSVKEQDDESNPDSMEEPDGESNPDRIEDQDGEMNPDDVENQDQDHEDPLPPCNTEQAISDSNTSILAPYRTQSATLRTNSHRPSLPHVDWLNKPSSAGLARTPPRTPTKSIDTPAGSTDTPEKSIDSPARGIDNKRETTISMKAPQKAIPRGIRVI